MQDAELTKLGSKPQVQQTSASRVLTLLCLCADSSKRYVGAEPERVLGNGSLRYAYENGSDPIRLPMGDLDTGVGPHSCVCKNQETCE